MASPPILLATLALVVVTAGCQQRLEDELGLKYKTPSTPADLEQFFTPAENQRASEYQADGETRNDMHEYYFGHHKMGWEWAIEAESAGHGHYYKSLDDVRGGLDAMTIGQDAFWLGYKSAVDQIAAARQKADNWSSGDSQYPNNDSINRSRIASRVLFVHHNFDSARLSRA